MSRFREMQSGNLFDLSDILAVEVGPGTRCVGQAISQRRRCMNPVSQSSRAEASHLLDVGTRLLESGEEEINDILEQLAPLLLCKGVHQNQAPHLLYDWSMDVQKFHDRRHASERFLRRSLSPAPGYSSLGARHSRALSYTPSRGSLAVRLPINERASFGRRFASSPTNTLYEQRNASPGAVSSNASSIGRATSPPRLTLAGSRSTFGETQARLEIMEQQLSELNSYLVSIQPTRPTFHGSSQRPIRDESTTARSEESNSSPFNHPESRASNNTRHEPARRLSSRGAMQARSEVRTSTPSTLPETARTARNPVSRQGSRNERVDRKHIEGDCPICFLPLLEDGLVVEGDEADDSDDDEEEDDYDEEEDDVQSRGEELVWCRKRCGNNFHKACIDLWVDTVRDRDNGRPPTCPICRAEWVVEQV